MSLEPRAGSAGRAGAAWEGPCAWLAGLLPLLMGLWAMPGWTTWRDDLALVRDLALVPVGSGGVLSTALSQLFGLLPVAARADRASLVGVAALAASSALAHSMLRAQLERSGRFALNPVLALLASQIWACSPALHADAARPGSSAIALLLVLLGMRLGLSPAPGARLAAYPPAGVLLGLTAGERPLAALVLLAVWLGQARMAERRPEEATPAPPLPDSRWWALGVAAAGAWGVCRLVPWLRGMASGLPIDLGSLEAAGTELGEVAGGVLASGAALGAAWLERLGAVALLLSLLGGVLGLLRAALRPLLLPWAMLLGASALGAAGGGTEVQSFCVLSGSLALAGGAAFALQHVVRWLWRRPLPFARPASVLCVAFAITLVLEPLERASVEAAPEELGAALWTEEALGRLPARSVLLVASPALALRVLAAQRLHGERPDVVQVPLPFLRGSLAERLFRLEPELAPLLRQLLVNGSPDEYALSRLADLRPLFMELDARWDPRLLAHAIPDALWLRFAPHAAGPSDRQSGVARSRSVLRRLLHSGQEPLDPATRELLARQAGQQALTLAALGDVDGANQLLRWVRRARPGHPLAVELQARLERGEHRRIAANELPWADLLRGELSPGAR